MNVLLPVSRGGMFGLALGLAIDTAKAHAGKIHVLFVVDAAEIERIESGARPGAIHLARHAADEARKRMTAEGTAEIAEAVRRIGEAGIPVRGEIREGEVGRELIAAAAANDLLVSAAASHFAPDREDASGKLVLSVMREGGIPVLLSGSAPRSARTIVAGCGGGTRTERAVGAMARLSLWKEAPRGILLAVDDAPEGERSGSPPRGGSSRTPATRRGRRRSSRGRAHRRSSPSAIRSTPTSSSWAVGESTASRICSGCRSPGAFSRTAAATCSSTCSAGGNGACHPTT